MQAPSLALNTGAKIPILGLGTWKSKPNEVKAAVEAAIDVGYRHIDCAYAYENEDEVGEAIRCKIEEGKIKREDIFVTTKIWISFLNGHVRECLEMSLKKLKLPYVDLCLMHMPFALKYVESKDRMYNVDDNGLPVLDQSVDYVDAWREMEKLCDAGLTKAIGVSNFNEFQIGRVIKETSVVPAVNQIEAHPYLDQESLWKYCQKNGILVTGYSPFGSPDNPYLPPNSPSLLQEPKLQTIADKYKKTVAQVLLKYLIQLNIIVIPKSVTPHRIASNFKVFDFNLSDGDMENIKDLNRNLRFCDMKFCSGHKYFSFRENYTE